MEEGFEQYITAHTDFKRTNESITSLIGMNYFKTIYLEPDSIVKDLITSHYKTNDGTLKMWGNILEYRLWTSEGVCDIYSIQGVKIGQKTFEIVEA